ncbi:acid protease [Apiospora phragmitis]|uniref:Acid protease n=1 Tax=Apiospora phragmitis TaxID=2905665 RepID=A0ABR1ULN6_9PEZI
MKTSTRLVAIVITALATGANTQLLLPFSRQAPRHGSAHQQRRSGSEDTSTDLKFFHMDTTYMVNVSVATTVTTTKGPGRIACALASGPTRVPPLVYELDNNYGYDTNKSFSVSYLDGTSAYGDSVRDVMELPGGVQVTNLTLGLASSTTTATGMLSLGFNSSTRSYYDPDDPTFVDRLLAGGQINSKAFSMWLDSEDATTGNLLLGAVDKSSFEAPLVRFDIEQSHKHSDGYTYTTNTFSAWVSSFNTSTANEGVLTPVQNKTALPFVTIDPSYTISELPQDLAEHIWSMAGATWDSSLDLATINCSQRDNLTGRVGIQFSSSYGPNLTVPLSDLVLPTDTWTTQKWDWDLHSATSICLFGVQNATKYNRQKQSWGEDPEYTIGAPLLKRSYLVFDLASKEMAMAPVNRRTPSVWSRRATIIRTITIVLPPMVLMGGRGSSGYDDDDEYGGLSRGGIIGLIVGMSIFGLVMLGVAIWGIVKCARDNKLLKPENAAYSEKAMVPTMAEAEKDAATSSVAAPVLAHLPSSRVVLMLQRPVRPQNYLRFPRLASSTSEDENSVGHQYLVVLMNSKVTWERKSIYNF